ncbi:MAG: cold shock domain-containing protein [Alphaproteobacteria bacterium]
MDTGNEDQFHGMAPMNDGDIESCEKMVCIVKWFNPIKGYGFVVPKVYTGDIFLHFSVVDEAGFQHLSAGSELVCMVSVNTQQRQVRKILEVKTPGNNNQQAHQGMPVQSMAPMGPLQQVDGEVKWFNSIRGFGFINPDTGDREVFVHSSVLRRSGLDKLNPGQRVRMQVAITDQGPQAWAVSVLDEGMHGQQAI